MARCAARPDRRLNILIVDDDEAVRRGLARYLRHHEVKAFSHGAEALRHLIDGAVYDLILCDVMMPELDGVGVYEWLQLLRPRLIPRVVFMTGGGFGDDISGFLDRVPNRCLWKPFDPRELREVVADRSKIDVEHESGGDRRR